MKIKGLTLLATVALTLSATSAQAETMVFSRALLQGNTCEQIAGHWEGAGVVKKSIVECNYDGRGDITVDDKTPGKFSMHIGLTKTSGICPAGEELDFVGVCENGVIKLKTPDADLHGDLTTQGDKLAINNMNGQVWVTLVGIRTAVDVSMKIHQTTRPMLPRVR